MQVLVIKIKEPRDLEDRIMRGDDTETLKSTGKGFHVRENLS